MAKSNSRWSNDNHHPGTKPQMTSMWDVFRGGKGEWKDNQVLSLSDYSQALAGRRGMIFHCTWDGTLIYIYIYFSSWKVSWNDADETLLMTEWLDRLGAAVLRCFQSHEKEMTWGSVQGCLPWQPTKVPHRLQRDGGTRKWHSGRWRGRGSLKCLSELAW